MPSCSSLVVGLANQPKSSNPAPPLPASSEDDLSRSTISLVLDVFFRFTVVVTKNAGNNGVVFGGIKDDPFGGDGEEGYDPPETDADVDVGEENEVGHEVGERAEPAPVTRHGPGDNDLDLAESVDGELATSDGSELSLGTDPVLLLVHPTLCPGLILPSDGDRGSEDEDEEGETAVTGSQNPCESFRSPRPGLVNGGEDRLSINAGPSPKTERAAASRPPLLRFVFLESSSSG